MKEIILIGYSGKMGKMIIDNISPPYKIVGLIDKDHNKIIETKPYAVIDFSSPKSTMFYAPYYISKKIPYITGTTGLTEEEINILKSMVNIHQSHFHLCSSFDPNLYTLLEYFNNIKNNFNKAIIEEWHHISKKDLPSGVAKSIIKALNPLNSKIISYRNNNLNQKHQITLVNNSQRLRITYEVLSRTVYMKGILMALEKVSLKGFFQGL